MLKYPLVASYPFTDHAISAAVERSAGKTFIQETTGKRANKIAFRVGLGWFYGVNWCVLGGISRSQAFACAG